MAGEQEERGNKMKSQVVRCSITLGFANLFTEFGLYFLKRGNHERVLKPSK